MSWWIRCILACFHSAVFSLYTLSFLSFCSDLFQDLSQLQETWLTEGEMCLQAAFPLSLYFSLIISSLMTVMRLDDVSVWKDWRTQKLKKKYSKKNILFLFYSALKETCCFPSSTKASECFLLPGFLPVNKVLLMHFYFNDFCDFGEKDDLFGSAESHWRAQTF